MNLTQRQLRMFVTTVAFGNISRAAQALHISQPALTRALQDFEAQLGTPLLRRTTRQLALTVEGERFLPRAQRLLQDMQRATEALRDPADDGQALDGLVTLAVGTAFGCSVLPAVLLAFTQAHPGVQVRLIDDNSAGITARVLRAEADLGIGSPIGDTGLLACEPLLTAPLGLLADPRRFPLGRSAAVGALPRLPLLKEAADTSIMHLLRSHGSELVAAMHRGVEVSSLAMQLALAQAGLGVAVLSGLGASHPAAIGLRFSPLRPALRREVFLMHRRDLPLTPAAEAFAQTLRQGLASAPLANGVRLSRR